MEALEDIAEHDPNRVQIIKKAKVTKLLKDSNGTVTGVEYEFNGKNYTENGPVILATGYAALISHEHSRLLTNHFVSFCVRVF